MLRIKELDSMFCHTFIRGVDAHVCKFKLSISEEVVCRFFVISENRGHPLPITFF